MYKPEQMVGLDVGNGATTITQMKKAANGGLAPAVVATFRSAVVKLKDSQKDIANYQDHSGAYLVGDRAVDFGNVEKGSTDSAFYSSERFRILQNYALTQLKSRADLCLVAGLPIESFEALKKDHRNWLVKNAADHPEAPAITGCRVIEQPKGTCFNPFVKNMEGESVKLYEGKTLVLDIGDGTLDGSEFFDGVLLTDRTIGESYAISDIHRAIFDQLQNDHSLDSRTSIDHIDRAFVRNKGFFDVSEKDVDLRKTRAYKQGVQQYLKRLKARVDAVFTGMNLFDHIAITGGGVDFIGAETLQKHLGLPARKLVIPPQPSESNAMGYCFFAQHAVQKAKKAAV